MPRRALSIVARSILAGWALLAVTFLAERPVLIWMSHLVGAHWFPTARLALDCVVLAIVGWVVGRLSSGGSIYGVVAFAVTLAFWDLDPLLGINLPWLIQLAADAFRNPLYLDSLVTTATEHALLFGCLVGGAILSQPKRLPESLFRGDRESSTVR
jgi:hypothetical protein